MRTVKYKLSHDKNQKLRVVLFRICVLLRQCCDRIGNSSAYQGNKQLMLLNNILLNNITVNIVLDRMMKDYYIANYLKNNTYMQFQYKTLFKIILRITNVFFSFINAAENFEKPKIMHNISIHHKNANEFQYINYR